MRTAMLMMGLGFGQLVGQLIQLVQDTAPAHQLGVATFASSANVVFSCATGVMVLAVFLATRLPGAARTQGI
ncbi:hypothetical protein ACFV6Z_15160 [Streptomyces sp. NPDC059818]|uniref:hypothetical protein n=1 Tax=Streptomyces sp. NPDC059818 TaxID=3346962 RepID=UPI003657F28A